MRLLPCVVALAALACTPEKKPEGPPPSRFAAVKNTAQQSAAAGSFCEKSFPAGARKFVPPPLRELPGAAPAPNTEVQGVPAPTTPSGKWRWVNLWATWCGPCVAEMPLLGRWLDALSQENVAVGLELLSVDEDGAALTDALQKPMPGPVTWLRSTPDLQPFLESLDVDKGAPIPVHVLVDPKGDARCVRVGSVHERDYGAVKAILSGG